MQVDSTAIKDSIALANLRKVPVLIDKSKQNTSIDSFIVAYNKDFKEYITLKKKMSLHATASDVEPLDRKFKAPDQIYILFALFLLLVLVSYFFSRDLSVMAQGFINNRILNQLVRDNNLLNSESFIFMAILIGLTFGYLLQILFGINELLGISGVGTYLLLSLFVMLFFMAKTIVLRLAGALFGIKNMVNNYISIIYISFGTFTLLLIPLLILYTLGPLVFKHNMIIVFSSILVLSFTYQYLRGAIFISSNFQFSKFYFIIYLCAFEICPLIILYKVLLN
ncbi:DUF4271 domain-containing protein [Solitalea lacus]|uniref:DUF4271 domain-containing protein n=1 Tax=Solitalea lacus TaxID=2911172 RepID=UPI001EDC6398|nr:DUF4271 domain-containing protein [Solitalea lacus]UKJ07359.1 DUF4271 domain-containing protein [Solitalea lacus]